MDAELCEHYFAALRFAARHYFVFVANDCPVLDAGYRWFFGGSPPFVFGGVFLVFCLPCRGKAAKNKGSYLGSWLKETAMQQLFP